MEPRICRITGAGPCISARENASLELLNVVGLALLYVVCSGAASLSTTLNREVVVIVYRRL